VIDGDLIINGNSRVGDPADPGAAAILVKGDVDLSNGTADLYGLFYTNGSITGKGTFYCEGSIAAKGAIDLKGNYTVEYHEIINDNLNPENPYVLSDYSIISAANTNYTWKTISYDEFSDAN